jgi:hypothetical protein
MNQFWRSIRKSSVAIFLIVAMLFGSFSQIAQARTGNLCLGHEKGAIEAPENHADAEKNQDQHCDDQANLTKIKGDAADQNHSKSQSANHGCCAAHCCVMKALDKADFKAPYHPLKESPLFVYESVHSSDFLFGIFRPPRLAV